MIFELLECVFSYQAFCASEIYSRIIRMYFRAFKHAIIDGQIILLQGFPELHRGAMWSKADVQLFEMYQPKTTNT